MSPGTDLERDVRALVATVLKLPVTPDAPVARNACAASSNPTGRKAYPWPRTVTS